MGLRVEISAGELVDKITILEIKLMFIEDEEKRKNEQKEQKAGEFGMITNVSINDTVSMIFEDGQQYIFPFEAVMRQTDLKFTERDGSQNYSAPSV